jgi:signal transduction histidine kinase
MRLLQRTIRLYSILSFCVLVIGIPVFYFLLQAVVRQEVDEELLVNRSELVKRLNHIEKIQDISQLNFLDRNITIQPQPNLSKTSLDSYSTISRYDSAIHETVQFRVLKTSIDVHGSNYMVTLAVAMVDHNDLIEIVLIVQVVLLALLFGGLWIINKSISSAYLLQKEFTENAAHEMQTPLAVLQSKLELLMQTSPINNTQAALISKMADASHRMNKLNKALVLLTRIQNHQFNDEERIDWRNLIDKLIDDYEDVITQKNIKVSINEVSSIKTDTNRMLLEILLGNLLSNAIRHNIQDGFINIIVHEKELLIENSGQLKALNTINIFQRFQKDSSDENSLGLGLEIIDKICVLNHYSLKYLYNSNKHCFILKL